MTKPTRDEIATDLVEYLVLVLPGLHAVEAICAELTRIVERSAIRILDMVVISVDENGSVDVTEAEAIECLAALYNVSERAGVLLSRHDIELVALALKPLSAAIVVVVEDRWAESLSMAARAAGGEVRAGERIARQRVELALAHTPDEEER